MSATPTKSDSYDAVVVGAGPNGLICAAYLAKAGARVLLIERRHETGGGLNTDEYFGFRFNLHAVYHMMSDVMPAYRDLGLADLGLRYVNPAVACAFPFGDGKALLFGRDLDETVASIATLSEHDADCYRRMWAEFAPMLERYIIPLTYRLPQPVVDQVVEIGETEVGARLNEISDLSPIEVIDEYGFTDARVRMALLSFSAMWGFHLDDPLGYLYPIYLCRMANASLVKGGSHRLSSALYRSFIGDGGEVLDSAEVTSIRSDGDGVEVEVAGGTRFSARAVASTLNPQQTFLDLVGAENLPTDLRFAVEGWEWEERTMFGLHLGVEGTVAHRHPEPRVGDAMIAFLGIETEDELHEHLGRVDAGTASGGEWVHVTVPSHHDRSMAPPGHEVVRAEQVVRYDDDWSSAGAAAFGDECLGLMEQHMDIGKIVLRRDYPPTHIEAKLHTMRRGSIKHGSYSNLQMGFNRPNDMCSRVETPIPGLFTCGASNYAGGMIIGGPGYLGAKVVGEHLGLDVA